MTTHNQPPCPRSNGRQASPGFTLVELMVVIVILGMVVSSVSVNWRTVIPGTQLSTSVRSISNALQTARTEAISRNNEFRVIYDLDQQRYWIETPYLKTGGLALQRIPGEDDPEEEDSRAVLSYTKMRDGVTISNIIIDDEEYIDGICYIRFSPLGASSAHTVSLHHEATNRDYTIEVLALTGQIRFHDGFYEREEVKDGDFD
jgi:prepilin-type N-terminal cleavage/methylation domain-containing protein